MERVREVVLSLEIDTNKRRVVRWFTLREDEPLDDYLNRVKQALVEILGEER